MINSLSYSLPEILEKAVQTSLDEWQKDNKINRLWQKDATIWTNTDEAKWLAWLDVVGVELNDLQKYKDFAEDVKQFESIVLLGMGGSSLCPEVLSITYGKTHFHILDSTVPAQVKAVENKVDLAKTLFIVASKSGSTLEPNCFKQYFFDRVSKTVGKENAGKQFIAITDPGSKMQQIAEADGFRHIFYGNPEIGGRFSALSAFGLTAAAAMGLDAEKLLNSAGSMVRSCKATNPNENPGAILGTILGTCHRNGRDKLTIFTPPEAYDLGAWLEQLIAESTGKNGVSIIPVDREPLQMVDAYGEDRIFVNFTMKGSEVDEDTLADLKDIEDSGNPMINIELENLYGLGQEFFRWEFATAVAGAIIGINPFDQPDVESAKIEARKITDAYEKSGTLPDEQPFFEEDGISLFAADEYAAELGNVVEDKTLAGFLEAHLWNIAENDYFAILAYIEMDAEHEQILQQIRTHVLEHYSVATCLGFGPRFLHSTGQAYKGGANNGVFLQITSDDAVDVPVPGQNFTFGVVKSAQARGDFQVLLDRGRRALRVHLGSDVKSGLEKLLELVV